jgi:MOSC domain-containing protein YiiM
MNLPDAASLTGRVSSLHLHPPDPNSPMQEVELVEVLESKGILNEPRYFGRLSRDTGQPSRRQVTLIEREQIAEHAATLGLESVLPGAVRSNIETSGIDLVSLIGKEIEIGDAILMLYAPRDPCEKMDAICKGLRELMMNNRQGVLAQVVRSGRIQVGDVISVRSESRPEPAASTSG